MFRQFGSIQLLGIRAVSRRIRALKRISKKLKIVGAENRRYQIVQKIRAMLCVRKSENKFPFLLNVFTLTNNHWSQQLSIPQEKEIRIKNLQIVIHGHYHSQNFCHEENSSDFRTDDNRWVQDLENLQDDLIRWSLCYIELVKRCVVVKKSYTTFKFPDDVSPE